MNTPIRVRFAPSPTGPLHIGGVRTALFNYLFAKKHGGTFVLRIEDTDQKRYVDSAEDYITNALNWCNIPFDEGPGKDGGFGPYRQSERKHLYRQYVDLLIENNKAYYAFDTAEALDEERKNHEAKGKTFIYNWHNRTRGRLINSLVLSKEEVAEKIANGEDYVVRFLAPQDETLELTDLIRGTIKIDTNTLDDKVLFKSDGMPTYHLANVVDDYLMKISHVIRGEEWLPSLALHQLLYNAFGWEAPEFAHLPLILKPTGKGKLSKRDGDKLGFPVFPLNWEDSATNSVSKGYKESGYFPEAVVNFLAFLGWNPGTEQELFSLSELVEAFDLKNVNKAGARFDPDKTKWFNHQYMQKATVETLTETFINTTPGLESIDPGYVELTVNLIKERATFPSEFWGLSHYFFEAPENFAEAALKKAWKEHSKDLMIQLISELEAADDTSVDTLQAAVKGWITKNEIGFGKIMMPLRVALVGALEGVDVFDIIYLIGKTETIKRIQSLIDRH
ncbi:glutamate--tRNA ligase [Flavobacteriaceae bacterium]|jgi:glutamyl-tRNA synthetase|nr:glutamate--tRNA ligase [Flavobacteriaceae bacterium]MDA7724037.1 glutamate--tRNA ligase [Flavobacteriaceae bacterium]MDB0003861.1 glutamate--tRNA ligase [Flavobacteriaceae bacterium]